MTHVRIRIRIRVRVGVRVKVFIDERRLGKEIDPWVGVKVRVRVDSSVRVRWGTLDGGTHVFPQAEPQCINTQHTTNDWVLNN